MTRVLTLATLVFSLSLAVGFTVSCGGDDDDDDDVGEGDDDTAGDDDETDDDTDDDDISDDDAENDTWSDSASGLVWQDGSSVGTEYFAWNDAVSYCDALSWGGFDDWRLPTISELRSLIRGCGATETDGSCGVTDECLDNILCWTDPCVGCEYAEGPGIDGAYWPAEILGAVFWYWSSSTVEDADDHAWFVLFYNSYVDYGLKEFDLSYARCVR